jgi:hypothetical protein
LIRDNPSRPPTAEQIASRLREEMARRHPFNKEKPKQSLDYRPALLLEH